MVGVETLVIVVGCSRVFDVMMSVFDMYAVRGVRCDARGLWSRGLYSGVVTSVDSDDRLAAGCRRPCRLVPAVYISEMN